MIGSGTTRDHHHGETTEERRGNDACDRAVIVHNTLLGNAGTLSGETRDYEPRDVVDDIDGHSRGTTHDIGADEYSTLAPLRRPLTAADVGPDAS